MIPLIYGNFEFPCNPAMLQIREGREFKEIPRPFAPPVVQPFGTLPRHVKGEGIFSGEDAFLQFLRFREMLGGQDRLLTLPGFRPFYAYFRQLDYLGVPGQGFVKYAFEFIENPSAQYSEPPVPDRHVADGNETLEDIARRYGLSVEHLLARNPALNSVRPRNGEAVLL